MAISGFYGILSASGVWLSSPPGPLSVNTEPAIIYLSSPDTEVELSGPLKVIPVQGTAYRVWHGFVTRPHIKDLVYGNYDGWVYCQDEKTNEILWGYETTGFIMDITGYDLDNDGLNEIIVACSSGIIYAIDHDGQEMWTFIDEDTPEDSQVSPTPQYPTETFPFWTVSVGNVYPSAVGGDDPVLRIFAGTTGKILYVFSINSSGMNTETFKVRAASNDSGVSRLNRPLIHLSCNDINHDGYDETVVIGDAVRFTSFSGERGGIPDFSTSFGNDVSSWLNLRPKGQLSGSLTPSWLHVGQIFNLSMPEEMSSSPTDQNDEFAIMIGSSNSEVAFYKNDGTKLGWYLPTEWLPIYRSFPTPYALNIAGEKYLAVTMGADVWKFKIGATTHQTIHVESAFYNEAVGGKDLKGIYFTAASLPSSFSVENYGMSYLNGNIIIFGGKLGASVTSTTYLWRDSWSTLSFSPDVKPSARENHAMVYNGFIGKIILFGGNTNSSGSTADNETWSLSQEGQTNGTWKYTWEQLSPSSSPDARFQHSMCFDIIRNRVILFGGWDGTDRMSDTWEYNGTDWIEVVTSNSPSARYGHKMVYDSYRKITILFGGNDSSGLSNETWIYDGNDWTEVTPASSGDSPSARMQFGMTYDALRGPVIIGGQTSTGAVRDRWAWNGEKWINKLSNESATAGVTARYNHNIEYDHTTSYILIATGRTNEDNLTSTVRILRSQLPSDNTEDIVISTHYTVPARGPLIPFLQGCSSSNGYGGNDVLYLGSSPNGDNNIYRLEFTDGWQSAIENLERSGRMADVQTNIQRIHDAVDLLPDIEDDNEFSDYTFIMNAGSVTSQAAFRNLLSGPTSFINRFPTLEKAAAVNLSFTLTGGTYTTAIYCPSLSSLPGGHCCPDIITPHLCCNTSGSIHFCGTPASSFPAISSATALDMLTAANDEAEAYYHRKFYITCMQNNAVPITPSLTEEILQGYPSFSGFIVSESLRRPNRGNRTPTQPNVITPHEEEIVIREFLEPTIEMFQDYNSSEFPKFFLFLNKHIDWYVVPGATQFMDVNNPTYNDSFFDDSWQRLFSSNNSDVLLLGDEVASSRSAEENFFSKIGLWFTGSSSGTHTRTIEDSFTSNRPRETGYPYTGSPHLCHLIKSHSTGTKFYYPKSHHFATTNVWTHVGHEGLSLFCKLLTKGILPRVEKHHFRNLSRATITMRNMEEKVLDVLHSTNNNDVGSWAQDRNSLLSSELAIWLNPAPIRESQLLARLSKRKYSVLNDVGSNPYGIIGLTPHWMPEERYEWPADLSLSTDGDKIFVNEDPYMPSEIADYVLEHFDNYANELPFKVISGDTFMQVTSEDDRTYKVYLIDPGYDQPNDRNITVRIQKTYNRSMSNITDVIFPDEIVEIEEDDTFDVFIPAGTFVILDVLLENIHSDSSFIILHSPSATVTAGSVSSESNTSLVILHSPSATVTVGSVSLESNTSLVILHSPSATVTVGSVSLESNTSLVILHSPSATVSTGNVSLDSNSSLVVFHSPSSTAEAGDIADILPSVIFIHSPSTRAVIDVHVNSVQSVIVLSSPNSLVESKTYVSTAYASIVLTSPDADVIPGSVDVESDAATVILFAGISTGKKSDSILSSIHLHSPVANVFVEDRLLMSNRRFLFYTDYYTLAAQAGLQISRSLSEAIEPIQRVNFRTFSNYENAARARITYLKVLQSSYDQIVTSSTSLDPMKDAFVAIYNHVVTYGGENVRGLDDHLTNINRKVSRTYSEIHFATTGEVISENNIREYY